jgi:hypothetical protein
MRLRPTIWLLLSLGWGLACGGRYEKTVEGDDQPDGGSSRGGTSGRAGSTSVGGTTSVAGSFGTAASGGVCVCHVDPNCGPTLRAVPNAAGCCQHCELDPMQCAAVEQGYQTFRAQVMQKYQALGCRSDSDCGLFDDPCGAASCGTPLLASQLVEVTEMLDSYALANRCGLCPRPPVPPCDFTPAPKCVMSRCQ